MESIIADVGAFEDIPNAESQMKGYIALSRVRDAESCIIARPFSPRLFSQGPHAFPTLLMKVLRKEVHEEDVPVECELTRQTLKTRRGDGSDLRLKNSMWKCGLCLKVLSWDNFISPQEKLSRWADDYERTIVRKGPYLACSTACVDTYKCNLCGWAPGARFPAWVSEHAARTGKRTHDSYRCAECSNPPCQNPTCGSCRTCRSAACRTPGTRGRWPAALHAKQQPCRSEEKQHWECDACQFPSCRRCGEAMSKRQRQIFRETTEFLQKLVKRSWTCGPCGRKRTSSEG